MSDIAEMLCRMCWWREGRACYNEKLLRAGGYNKIPRTVEGDDRNGMELTDALWEACPVTSKAFLAQRAKDNQHHESDDLLAAQTMARHVGLEEQKP